MKDDQVRPTREPAGAPLHSQTRPAHRILVADDQSATHRLSTDALVDRGCHVDAAEDGAVDWKAVQAKQYDLLITDNFMSNVAGIELVKNLIRVRGFHNQT